MASSWCNDTARFDVSVVREEGGSEERQGSTEGLHLLKHWTKGQHLLVTHFTALESQRQIFQPEKWWKAQQRQPLHGMVQHNFCLMCWGLTGPCISKGKLDNKKTSHWLKSRADISTTTPEDESRHPLHAVLPLIFAYMSNSMSVQKGNFKVQCILH